MVRSSRAATKEVRFSLREIAGGGRGSGVPAIRLALRARGQQRARRARLLRVDYKTLHVKESSSSAFPRNSSGSPDVVSRPRLWRRHHGVLTIVLATAPDSCPEAAPSARVVPARRHVFALLRSAVPVG